MDFVKHVAHAKGFLGAIHDKYLPVFAQVSMPSTYVYVFLAKTTFLRHHPFMVLNSYSCIPPEHDLACIWIEDTSSYCRISAVRSPIRKYVTLLLVF